MVVEHGGAFSMNLNNSVTHSIAAESKGLKFQAAKRQGDVIHYSWLFDCCSQKKLLPLQPKYFLFLSDSSKKKLEEEIDAFSDSYFCDLSATELKQLLSNIDPKVDAKVIDYYKKKHCPKEKWAHFCDYCIYFHLPKPFLKNMDWKVLLELAMRRMKVEVSTSGGSVATDLSHASHVVIMSSPNNNMDFETLLSSFSVADRHVLRSRKLHIVDSQWLEDCLEKDQKLPEDHYSLKPPGFEETVVEESEKLDGDQEDHDSLDKLAKQDASPSSDKIGEQRKSNPSKKPRVVDSSNLAEKRKLGRPSKTSTNRGRRGVIQPRKTRAQYGNKPAKISEIEPDENGSSDEQTIEAEITSKPPKILEDELRAPSADEHSSKSEFEAQMEDDVKDLESSDGGKAVEHEVEEHGKVETFIDPVQAMLLNMIPSLATKKEDETKIAEGIVPEHEEGRLFSDPDKKPAKKKKVSYKDAANELLKDW